MPRIPFPGAVRACRTALFCVFPVFLIACGARYVVNVRSDPPGAKVSDLSKGYLGTTDFDVPVGKGESLNLSFCKPGYEDQRIIVPEINRDQTVMVTLYDLRASVIHVETIPSGAVLQIFAGDGAPVALDNPSKYPGEPCYANRSYRIPDGLDLATITLSMDGYEPKTVTVRLEANKENHFTFTLDRIAPTLRIQTVPEEGAEVFERSLGYLGRTPLEFTLDWKRLTHVTKKNPEEIESATLHLYIRKPGYREKEVVETFNPRDKDGTPVFLVELERLDGEAPPTAEGTDVRQPPRNGGGKP